MTDVRHEENSRLQTADLEVASVRERFLEEICEIERESFSAPYPPQVFCSMARETADTFLVANSKQETLGYVLAILRKDSGRVLSIAVRRGYRRKGVGTKLMTELLKVLQGKRVKRVELEVRVSNYAAQEFYRKLGFREVGMIEQYYPDGEDAVKMSRSLQ